MENILINEERRKDSKVKTTNFLVTLLVISITISLVYLCIYNPDKFLIIPLVSTISLLLSYYFKEKN